jgi:hypothetical protein
MLTGTPIAGALISHDNGGFKYAIIFAASTIFAGSIFLVLARIARVGIKKHRHYYIMGHRTVYHSIARMLINYITTTTLSTLAINFVEFHI